MVIFGLRIEVLERMKGSHVCHKYKGLAAAGTFLLSNDSSDCSVVGEKWEYKWKTDAHGRLLWANIGL